ncbi:hypothetical protein MMC11_000851 [Xylographa trunciseda]|nr:hypothetical protein [Xylographa trunciseda]
MANYMEMYYLPFYFQAVLGNSAIRSGVNFIALAFPELLGIMISGALTTRFGHYVRAGNTTVIRFVTDSWTSQIPFILIGQAICAIGTGLLTTLGLNTSTALWAVFLVLVGFGLGMGINAPHIAIQAVFESDNDVFIANGVATFFSQLGGSIAVSIGESLLVNGLLREVPKHTQAVSPQAVIDAGALGLLSLATSPITIQALRQSYVIAISDIFIFTTAIVCVSIPMACGMQWLNVKTISKEREERKGKGHLEKDSGGVVAPAADMEKDSQAAAAV